jgi:riboflavin synthase
MLFFTAVHTTIGKTTLAGIRVNHRVNLERSLTPSSRMGGHFVLGHVDGTGTIESDTGTGTGLVRKIRIPHHMRMLTAPGGSVAIDGVSLTIAESFAESITVSLIPYTMKDTTLGAGRPGDMVNIECDVLARYLFHIYKQEKSPTGIPDDSGGDNLLTKLEKFGF